MRQALATAPGGNSEVGDSASVLAYLRAVVAASECLVAETDLARGVDAALAALRHHTGLDRVYVFRDVPGRDAHVLFGESHHPSVTSVRDLFGDQLLHDADFPELIVAVRAFKVYQSIHAQRLGANADVNNLVGTRSDLMVPIAVEGTFWGVIGFDDCQRDRTWSSAEISALQGAASAIAAAILRQQAEEARLTAEQLHSSEIAAVNRLLEGVVSASRALLEDDDFDGAMRGWLAYLATAVDADRAIYGDFTPARAEGAVAAVHLDWTRPGLRCTQQDDIPASSDFLAWAERLARGETIWAHRDELLDSASVRYWESTGCWTNLIVPVVVDQHTVGWLCFDFETRREWKPAMGSVLRTAADAAAAAIKRRWAVTAMLAERDRRIAGEQLRADEAARHATQSERHSALLAAVAAAAEELLAARDPRPCLDAILARVGQVTHAMRACVARIDWLPDDPSLHGWQEIVHEWSAEGVARQMEGTLRRFAMSRTDATWERSPEQFATERRIVALIADQDEPFRSEQLALGVVWTLCYPIQVEDEVWGLLGLDYTTRLEDCEEADLAALQTLASTIAHALSRQRQEQRTLKAERLRADENARMAGLLARVVQSSRLLIDAAPEAFESALVRWLGMFGHETHATRASFYDLVTFEPTGQTTARMLCEWVRDGVEGSVPVSFAQPYVVDPRGAEALFDRMMSGEVVAFHTDELSGPIHEFLAQQGNATVITVPVFMDGRQWGNLSFDFAERYALEAPLVAVLSTAADTLAAMLKRNEATRQALAEREARIAIEQRRFSELAHANDALGMSLDALADNEGEHGFLRRSLLQIHTQAGASGAWLFGCDETGATLRLLGSVVDGTFSREGRADDPPMFRHGFSMQPELLAQLVARGRLLWRRVDPDTVVEADTPESIRWHLRQGHRANALHALLIGARQIGLVGMVFDTDLPPSDAQQELIHTLCQPLTLALELTRLADESRTNESRAAVLAERERMAAEIHDNLAQSFTSIAMQSESLAGLLADDEDKSRVLRLIERTAREGLAEARMSVLALLPADGWPGSLDQSLAALAERSSIRGGIECRFESTGVACAMPGPVQESLLRIAQEATSNAMRHSGGTLVLIRLDYVHRWLHLTIEDDGHGLPAADGQRQNGGFGVTGMENRAAAIGATLALGRSALGGLGVHVEMPCHRPGGSLK